MSRSQKLLLNAYVQRLDFISHYCHITIIGGESVFFLDLAQYKDALANGNRCLFIPDEDCRNWMSIKMEGNVLPSVSKFNELWCILDGNGKCQSSNSSI